MQAFNSLHNFPKATQVQIFRVARMVLRDKSVVWLVERLEQRPAAIQNRSNNALGQEGFEWHQLKKYQSFLLQKTGEFVKNLSPLEIVNSSPFRAELYRQLGGVLLNFSNQKWKMPTFSYSFCKRRWRIHRYQQYL